jgi:hypothetical protein
LHQNFVVFACSPSIYSFSEVDAILAVLPLMLRLPINSIAHIQPWFCWRMLPMMGAMTVLCLVHCRALEDIVEENTTSSDDVVQKLHDENGHYG